MGTTHEPIVTHFRGLLRRGKLRRRVKGVFVADGHGVRGALAWEVRFQAGRYRLRTDKGEILLIDVSEGRLFCGRVVKKK